MNILKTFNNYTADELAEYVELYNDSPLNDVEESYNNDIKDVLKNNDFNGNTIFQIREETFLLTADGDFLFNVWEGGDKPVCFYELCTNWYLEWGQDEIKYTVAQYEKLDNAFKETQEELLKATELKNRFKSSLTAMTEAYLKAIDDKIELMGLVHNLGGDLKSLED